MGKDRTRAKDLKCAFGSDPADCSASTFTFTCVCTFAFGSTTEVHCSAAFSASAVSTFAAFSAAAASAAAASAAAAWAMVGASDGTGSSVAERAVAERAVAANPFEGRACNNKHTIQLALGMGHGEPGRGWDEGEKKGDWREKNVRATNRKRGI